MAFRFVTHQIWLECYMKQQQAALTESFRSHSTPSRPCVDLYQGEHFSPAGHPNEHRINQEVMQLIERLFCYHEILN